jgi:hypothetical protein
MTEPTKGLRVMLANPTHDPGHVLFDAPGKKGQIPTTQEAQANVEYINRLIEEHERRRDALDLIERYGGIDGEHHKTWVIDQVARALTGEDYRKWVTEMKAGEDGPETYSWDEGIPP